MSFCMKTFHLCRGLQGVKLLFYNSKADILLLDISATIPDRFNPYLLGFDGSAITVPKRAVGIHHPHGNFKHISYANSRSALTSKKRLGQHLLPSLPSPKTEEASDPAAGLACSPLATLHSSRDEDYQG